MRRLACMLCVLLAACQPRPAPEPPTPQPAPEWPPVAYDPADADTWRVQPGSSRVDVIVRRAGPLARFGHDHVLSTDAIEGWLTWNPEMPAEARGDLQLAVAALQVDPPAARRRHDVRGDPSPGDIEGTRENMKREVLLAERWPQVRVALTAPTRVRDGWRVHAELVLNGRPADYEVPVSLQHEGDMLVAQGAFEVLQSHHGIEPFSVLGGSLAVADEVAVEFTIRAASGS